MANKPCIDRNLPQSAFFPDVFSREDLAAALGVSIRTLDRWHRLRIGPPRIEVGKRRLYRAEAVQKWFERNEISF